MRYLKYVLCVVLFQVAAFARVQQWILCGNGYSPSDCRFATGIVQLSLDQLKLTIGGWRWVVVRQENWAAVAKQFNVDSSVPAFSDLGLRSTYIDSSLVVFDTRVDEDLQRLSSRRGLDRLRWVIAHESGHILCETKDDRAAEDAGRRLMSGKKDVCSTNRHAARAKERQIAKGD